MRIDGQCHHIVVVPERVLQLAHQRRKLLLVLVRLLVDRSLGQSNRVLEARPQRPQSALDLDRPIGRELPRQVQSIEFVRLHQRVRTVDERHTGGARLEQLQVLGARILGGRVVVAAAHRQDDLERGELALQLRDDAIVTLALVEVERRIERFEFVCGRVQTGAGVDEMRAEGQRGLQIGDGQLAEACVQRLTMKRGFFFK